MNLHKYIYMYLWLYIYGNTSTVYIGSIYLYLDSVEEIDNMNGSLEKHSNIYKYDTQIFLLDIIFTNFIVIFFRFSYVFMQTRRVHDMLVGECLNCFCIRFMNAFDDITITVRCN